MAGAGGVPHTGAKVAEREGFEPSSRETREPDFESGAFDHSATSPRLGRIMQPANSSRPGRTVAATKARDHTEPAADAQLPDQGAA